MSVTRSRFAPKYPAATSSDAAPAGPTLAEALADRAVALVRIRCRHNQAQTRYHDLVAFTAEYRRIWFDAEDYNADKAIRAELIAWYTALHPSVDWTRDHQIDLRSGAVQSAPEAWEDGFIPEDDRAYGGGPAVYLADGSSWLDAPAITLPTLAEIGVSP